MRYLETAVADRDKGPFELFASRRESQITMGNKDRRKEKKKLKQPKETPKSSNPGRPGGARPGK